MQTLGAYLLLSWGQSATRGQSLIRYAKLSKNPFSIGVNVRWKGNLTRKLIRVHYPSASGDPNNAGLNKNPQPTTPTNSSSVFNTTMGEVMMTNSKRKIAIEGSRLVEEAIKCGLKLEKLFLSNTLKNLSPMLQPYLEKQEDQSQHLQNSRDKSSPEIHRVSSKLMQTWSSVTTPPGIIGVFQKPKSTEITHRVDTLNRSIPLTIICDNIREPGNLGSILRSAAGVGCRSVLLTKGCVDCWNMKVLRGACGAHFYIPISQDEETMSIEHRILNDLDKNKETIKEETKSNEESDSEMMPNRRMKVGVILADSNETDTRFNVPLLNYSEVDYLSFTHIFLTIGGETEGLGKEVISLVTKLSHNDSIQVCRVRVPLYYNVDSLNASNAFGIIAFEIQRQLTSRKEPSH